MYDVVVVGAGPGGLVLSLKLAKAGFNVALLDRRLRSDVGNKVCGEGIGCSIFTRVGVEPPKPGEYFQRIKGLAFVSPSGSATIKLPAKPEGYMLNRERFQQRLLRQAIDKGLDFYEATTALKPIFKNGYVVGVQARNWVKNKVLEVKGKIVVDASGFCTNLPRSVPEEWLIEKDAGPYDVLICYREIRELPHRVIEDDFAYVYLFLNGDPSLYGWIFPRGNSQVNAGVGVVYSGKPRNPKKEYEAFASSRGLLKGSKLIHAGGGVVPIRRMRPSLVGNGFLMVGDSGWVANPVHGGGMSTAMLSANLAAETVEGALEEGSYSIRSLWDYNVKLVKEYGRKQAMLEAIRLAVQSLSAKDVEYLMSSNLLSDSEISSLMSGTKALSSIAKLQGLFKLARRPSLLVKLGKVRAILSKVNDLYSSYPQSIEGLRSWSFEVKKLFDGLKGELGG